MLITLITECEKTLKQRETSNHKEQLTSKTSTKGKMTFKNLVKEETFKSVSESDKLIIIHKSKSLIWGKVLITLIT